MGTAMTSENPTEWAGPSRYYRYCSAQGTRHWGPDGAAGALAWTQCSDGVRCVLLARRSRHVQNGGTWAFPGGAIDNGEDALSAAIRELREEIDADLQPAGLTGSVEAICQHGCGWMYSTFVIRVRPQDGEVPFADIARDAYNAWETTDVAWFPLDAVDSLELHPGMRAAWPTLHAMIERA